MRSPKLLFTMLPAALTLLFFAGCGGTKDLTDEVLDCKCCPGGGLLDGRVNSAADEFAAFVEFAPDETALWLTSSRTVEGKKLTSLPNEIFIARHQAKLDATRPHRGWGAAERIASVNPGFDAWTKGAVAIRGDEMIIAAEQPRDPSGALMAGASGYNLFLWKLKKDLAGRFASPAIVENVNAPDAWTSQPALSPGGDTLLFVSDRPNPYDAADTSVNIWYSVRSGGQWQTPSIVKALASKSDDMSPAIDASGAVYFASRWDFEKNAPSKSGFDLYLAGSLPDLLRGASPAPVNLNALTRQAGYDVNTASDELFPCIARTELGNVLFWSSNRGGGYGGFDVYACRLPVPKIWMQPKVYCFEKGNVAVKNIAVEGRAMDPQELLVTVNGIGRPMASGQKIQVDVGDRVTFTRLNRGEECVTIDCRPVDTVAKLGDTLQVVPVNCDCNPRAVETILISDASGIPYFVTGYWWPNTSANYAAFNKSWSAGTLGRAKFIDPGDYDYACASKTIDDFFEKSIYQKLDNVVRKVDKCAEKDITLLITLVGYTDPCGLKDGSYTDEAVAMKNVRIASGTSMQVSQLPSTDGGRAVPLKDRGQNGNVILSMLRSYFTMKTIDRDMSARSEAYRDFKQRGRIVFDYDGLGIHDPTAWRGTMKTTMATNESDCRKRVTQRNLPCNNPEGRRIEIFVTPIIGDPATAGRPFETDFLQKEIVQPDAKPKACDCFRAEHVFSDSGQAAFVLDILRRFLPEEQQRADSIVLSTEADEKGRTVYALRSGCLSDAAKALETEKLLRNTAKAAASMLDAYAPRSAPTCRFVSISFGTYVYLKNAQVLVDTLSTVLGCPLWIQETLDADGTGKAYSIRTGSFSTPAEGEEAMRQYGDTLKKRRMTLPMRVMVELQ
jgi:hypothetical protein